MSETKILETLVSRFDQLDKRLDSKFDQIDHRFEGIEKKLEDHDHHFSQVDKRLDKLVNILEEQNIELYNIKSSLKNHDRRFEEMGNDIRKIHNQTVRLSIGQSELDMKIDKLLHSDRINNKKDRGNINNV